MAAVAALAAANASAAVVMLTGIEMRGEVCEGRCFDERRKYGVFIKLTSQKGMLKNRVSLKPTVYMS
jgi:hypothetical protein